MPRAESFHHANDGRGARRVYVNGNEIKCAIWCDTAQGIVIYAPKPSRLKRPGCDELYTMRLRGRVTVEAII